MKSAKLHELTTDELVDRFAELGVAQDKAEVYDETSTYNKLFKEMTSVNQQLRARGLGARLALLKLLSHPNAQVRTQAAIVSLAVAPEAARKALEAIRASNWQPQAMDAGIILRGLDDGRFKPD
jgi:hypothetical protein